MKTLLKRLRRLTLGLLTFVIALGLLGATYQASK